MFFSRKEPKALALLCEAFDEQYNYRVLSVGFCPKLGEADPGGLGACPQQKSTLSDVQKRSKALALRGFNKQYKQVLSLVFRPKLGEADPGGLGACPQQNSTLSDVLFAFASFLEKKNMRSWR
jgi:hypothetical protein